MEAVSENSPTRSPDELVYRVVTDIAEAEGCDPAELPPLYDAIDPEVFDTMLHRDVRLSFSYLDYEVTITSDDSVQVASK